MYLNESTGQEETRDCISPTGVLCYTLVRTQSFLTYEIGNGTATWGRLPGVELLTPEGASQIKPGISNPWLSRLGLDLRKARAHYKSR